MFVVLAILLYTIVSCLAGVFLGAVIKAGSTRRLAQHRPSPKSRIERTFFTPHVPVGR